MQAVHVPTSMLRTFAARSGTVLLVGSAWLLLLPRCADARSRPAVCVSTSVGCRFALWARAASMPWGLLACFLLALPPRRVLLLGVDGWTARGAERATDELAMLTRWKNTHTHKRTTTSTSTTTHTTTITSTCTTHVRENHARAHTHPQPHAQPQP